MQYNDKIIFKYLDPTGNDIISKFSDKDIYELCVYLNKYYLEYRNGIDVGKDITFGIEIEMEHFNGSVNDYWPFQLELNNVVGNDNWDVRNDITLDWGREIVSPILTDNANTWDEIKKTCNFISNYGKIDTNCSSHIHVGSQIYGDNTLYWYRLMKLWSIYENIIYRFNYGEYLCHRPKINKYSKCCSRFFDCFLNDQDILGKNVYKMLVSMGEYVDYYDNLKNFSLSFWHMLCDDEYNLYEDYNKINRYCTVESRCSNGTLDFVVLQNYINFFIKMMMYCKSDRYDEDIINRRKNININIYDKIEDYNKINIEQAIELSDMIFDNNLDKIYFLRQYIKNFEVSNKFVKTRRFTL